MSNYTTFEYRIKDSTDGKHLDAHAVQVNHIWNFCNELDRKAIEDYQKLKLQSPEKNIPCKVYTEYDLHKELKGFSKKTLLNSTTIQEVARFFANAKKAKLKYVFDKIKSKSKSFGSPTVSWRSNKTSIPWIPLKKISFQMFEQLAQTNIKTRKAKSEQSIITYQKHNYKYWNSRPLPADAVINTAYFKKNSEGKWFLKIVFKSASFELAKLKKHKAPNSHVGIDLGIKDVVTLSIKDKILGYKPIVRKATKDYESKLALAQRAKKKRQISKIHNKIKNVRKDQLHKLSTIICKRYANIAVGNVKSQDIIDLNLNSNMNKGVYDAGWYFLKTLFRYKSKKFNCIYEEISEEYTTQECNKCSTICGPKGTDGLKVRNWICSQCHAVHDRDINSALNIKKRFLSLHRKVQTVRDI